MTCSLARLARLLAAVLLLALAVPLAGQSLSQAASAAEPTSESQLLALTNSARAKAGLPALHSSATLVAIARGWADHMAAAGALSHNPGVAARLSGWSSLGENVAKAYSAAQAQGLFMGSSGHRANILDRSYDRVGIGVTRAADGSLWITVDFEQTSGYTPPAATPKPAPSPVKKPATKPKAGGSARVAAATRPNRSLTRGAVPAATTAGLRAPALAAGAAAARGARLSVQDAALATPLLVAAAAEPVAPASPGSPASIVLLACVAGLAVSASVAAQLVLESRPSRR